MLKSDKPIKRSLNLVKFLPDQNCYPLQPVVGLVNRVAFLLGLFLTDLLRMIVAFGNLDIVTLVLRNVLANWNTHLMAFLLRDISALFFIQEVKLIRHQEVKIVSIFCLVHYSKYHVRHQIGSAAKTV